MSSLKRKKPSRKSKKSNYLCYLEITSWAGISIGAEHFYGSLRWYAPDGENRYQEHRLEHPMTQAEATAQNKKDRDRGDRSNLWKRGSMTGNYATVEEVEKNALKVFEEITSCQFLVSGSHCVLDPMKVLAGPPEFVRRGNEIVARAEANDWWEGNEANMKKISEQWKELLNDFNIERS